jgi:hypothetical protein
VPYLASPTGLQPLYLTTLSAILQVILQGSVLA